jgi:hypothetical protein
MKREDLKNKGLTDEQIEFVMQQNGQDIEAAKQNAAASEKARADGLQSQLETLTNDLTTARNEANSLKDVQTRLDAANAKVKAYQQDETILGALAAYNPKDAKMLMKLLDRSKIVFGEDGAIVSGLKEQVDPLKEHSGYIFTDSPDPNGGNQNPGNGGGAFDMNAFLRG